jgi:hypothetical protein
MTTTQLSAHRRSTRISLSTCPHTPQCPAVDAPDHNAAHVVASHPEQGWSLLCNGVVMFDDTGEILPDRTVVAPHRPGVTTLSNAA